MTSTAKAQLEAVQILRQSAATLYRMSKMNLDGVTHAESLVQPPPAGNCMNWVLGHLVSIYDVMLPLLNQAPVLDAETSKHFARGSQPVREPGQAVEFSKLVAAWDESSRRVDAGLASLTSEVLSSPAPFSPTKNPDETVRSLLAFLLVHQAYHVGQTGLLRRIAGKPGGIA